MNLGLVLSIGLHLAVALMLTLELYTKPYKMHEPETIVVDLIEIEKKNNVQTSKQKAPVKNTEQKLAEQFYKERKIDVNTVAKKVEKVKEVVKQEDKVTKHQEHKALETTKPQKAEAKSTPQPTQPVTVSDPLATPKPDVNNATSEPKEKQKTVSNFNTKNTTEESTKIQSENAKRRDIDSFAKSVMDTLDVNTAKERQYKASISDVLGETEEAFDPTSKLSISEVSYIRRKISQHWNTTYFASISAIDLGADVLVVLNQDGSIKHVEVEHSYGKSLPQYQLFLDSVLSAVWKASPLDQLKPEHFEAWQQMVISFDPSGIVW